MGQVYNRFTTSTKNRAAGKHKDRPLTVIIPAAGMGHRMKSYGPKCLLPANIKETILDKSIKTIKKVYNYCEIILVVGFAYEWVKGDLDWVKMKLKYGEGRYSQLKIKDN